MKDLLKPVVCVHILGGLGNQMFGAAAGMALATRLGARLEFDLWHYEIVATRGYQLGRFGLPVTIRPNRPRRGKSSLRLFGRKDMGVNVVPEDWRDSVWRESGFHYDDTFTEIPGSTYLLGYFQSYRYFEQIADQVRATFNLEPHLSDQGRRLAALASGDDTVAVHIRRGDYVSDPAVAKIHTVLDNGYYQRSLELLARTVSNPRIIVVSDDIPAARQFLSSWPNAHFATETTALDDMHVIASCRHRVIANSSFSWWGAWLDARPNGITLAPRQWFTRVKMLDMHMNDLFPPGWLLT